MKQALAVWLRQHANEFGLTKDDGSPNEQGIGAGLYLQVTLGNDGAPRRSWIFRFATTEQEREAGYGRERQMGLGSVEALGHRRRERFQRLADDDFNCAAARRPGCAVPRLGTRNSIIGN